MLAVSDAYVELFVGNDVSTRVTASTSADCTLTTPGPPLNGARWVLAALPGGATRRCDITLTALPVMFPGGGGLRARIASDTNVDPVPENNIGRAYDVIVSPVDYIRDMALSIRSPLGILRQGVPYEVDFTLSNLGPGQEGNPNFTQSIISETYLVGPGSGEYFALAWSGDPDCLYRVFDIGSETFARTSEIIFGPLAPGQSRTCTMLLAVLPGARGTRQLPFWNWAEGAGVFDMRLDNNIADLVLQYEPAAIPSTSHTALQLLILGLAALGLRRLLRPF